MEHCCPTRAHSWTIPRRGCHPLTLSPDKSASDRIDQAFFLSRQSRRGSPPPTQHWHTHGDPPKLGRPKAFPKKFLPRPPAQDSPGRGDRDPPQNQAVSGQFQTTKKSAQNPQGGFWLPTLRVRSSELGRTLLLTTSCNDSLASISELNSLPGQQLSSSI